MKAPQQQGAFVLKTNTTLDNRIIEGWLFLTINNEKVGKETAGNKY